MDCGSKEWLTMLRKMRKARPWILRKGKGSKVMDRTRTLELRRGKDPLFREEVRKRPCYPRGPRVSDPRVISKRE